MAVIIYDSRLDSQRCRNLQKQMEICTTKNSSECIKTSIRDDATTYLTGVAVLPWLPATTGVNPASFCPSASPVTHEWMSPTGIFRRSALPWFTPTMTTAPSLLPRFRELFGTWPASTKGPTLGVPPRRPSSLSSCEWGNSTVQWVLLSLSGYI